MTIAPADVDTSKPKSFRFRGRKNELPDASAREPQTAPERMPALTPSPTLTNELVELRRLRDAGDGSASRKLRKQLASRYGVTTRTIDNWMPIVTLGPELRDAVDRGQLPPGLAAKLVRASPEMVARVTAALAAGHSVAAIKKLVRKPRVPAENQAATAATLISQAHDLLLRAQRLPPEMFPRAANDETWSTLKAVSAIVTDLLARRPRLVLKFKKTLTKGGPKTT